MVYACMCVRDCSLSPAMKHVKYGEQNTPAALNLEFVDPLAEDQ